MDWLQSGCCVRVIFLFSFFHFWKEEKNVTIGMLLFLLLGIIMQDSKEQPKKHASGTDLRAYAVHC
jgi:glucose uptake protein GlcU